MPALLITLLLWATAATTAQPLVPIDLRTQYEVAPLGLDEATPGLSWRFESGERGERQTAYRILVASRPDLLEEGTADIWDSGVVHSEESVQIPYGGPALESATRFHWTVAAWDRHGLQGPYAEPTFFETGLLHEADWSARWISAVAPADTSLAPRPAPHFRRAFRVDIPVTTARLYIAGLGYHEAVLNGRPVGDHVLDPAVTRYDRRVLYVAHDVTGLLQQGENALGVILGTGWYNMHTKAAWDFDRAPWCAQPALKAQLVLTYADGSNRTIVTDASWKVRTGPITFDGIHNGESYDARLEIEGWANADTQVEGWSPAYEINGPEGRLSSQYLPPIRVVRTLSPTAITRPAPNRHVYDFGENLAGRVRLTATGPAGAEIVIRHGERLHEDGTLDLKELSRFVFTGETQTARYTLGLTQPSSWSPRFVYHGFQYAEVTVPEGVEVIDLTAEVLHTDFVPIGTFASSSTLLNRIHDATLRAYLGNYHGYPTDCPHREKIGWTGDAHLVAEVGLYNFDAVTSYMKWIDDFVDEQRENGQVAPIIPTSGWGYEWASQGLYRERGRGPQWEGAFALIPPNRGSTGFSSPRILLSDGEAPAHTPARPTFS